MKKVLSFILCFLCCLSSCKEVTTEYDDKTIAKIEVTQTEGFGLGFNYKRIFDFTKGTVFDITIADDFVLKRLKEQYNDPESYTHKEYASLEEYEAYLISHYNTLNEVTNFTEEEGNAFLNEIISLGIYTWEDEYITDEIICDAGSSIFIIFFTDGTEKTTKIYFKYPKNYEDILLSFKEHFTVGCWYGSKA